MFALKTTLEYFSSFKNVFGQYFLKSPAINCRFQHVKPASNTKQPNDATSKVSAEDLKELSVRYPAPLGTLNNIMSVVTNELKKNGKALSFVHKPLATGRKQITGWTCQCHLSWPEAASFTAVGKSKQEATKIAALQALQWLNLAGKLKDNKPVIYDTKTVSSLKKSNVEVVLDNRAAERIQVLLDEYETRIKDMIETSLRRVDVEKIEIPTAPVRPNRFEMSEVTRGKLSNARNKLLKQRALHRSSHPDLEEIIQKQEQLPIYQFREKILETMDSSQVVVIKGEPGCGKSTQVPQYILEAAALSGSACDVNVIVTQPRRISAIALAERVAKERGEQLGDAIGYQVRFKSKHTKPPGGSINFCTSGILLRTLQTNPRLEGISHVILDEAHERDVNTDLLMLLLRRVLGENSNLKLIVMSATINPELFQNYFQGADALSIPGFTYPVESFYLDAIHQVDLSKTKSGKDLKIPRLFYDEMAELMKWIDKTKPAGAVLCFLPGWQDIKAMRTHLQSILDPNTSVVIPLHSRLTIEDQNLVFWNPPEGVRKIILSTNVAETSVTIDDVVYVIDTGVHKEERLSADNASSTLDDQWISQANANQRRGRAGRVRPGECYHLYTKDRYNELPMFPIPELHRVPLEKVVLDLKTYNEDEKAADFLSNMPEPPTDEAIECAIKELVQLEALTPDETLTALGRRIAKFTTSPRLSKALVHAAIFRCLDPMLTLISLLSAQADLFANSLEERYKIAGIKREFGHNSDHVAMISIYNHWKRLYESRGNHDGFCANNMLRTNTLHLITRLRKLNMEHLVECKMVEDNVHGEDLDIPASPHLVNTLLLSGTLSYLFHRTWDIKNGRIKLNTNALFTESGNKATLVSDSVCHKQKSLDSPFLTYYRKQESAVRRSFIVRDASSIPPLALALTLPQCAQDNMIADLAVLDDRRYSPFRLLANQRDAHVISSLQDVLSSVVKYFLTYEGTDRCGNYEEISQFRESLVVSLNQLLESSSHKTYNSNSVPP